MLFYVYDMVERYLNVTDYTRIAESNVRCIIPPKDGDMLIISNMPIEYEDLNIEDRLAQFVFLTTAIILMGCLCGLTFYKAAKPVRYESITFNRSSDANYYVDPESQPGSTHEYSVVSPPKYKQEEI